MFRFGVNELAIICALCGVLVFLPLAIVLAGRRHK